MFALIASLFLFFAPQGLPGGGGFDPYAGWTVPVASADSRIVYVSWSAGNDANSGLTRQLPKKTIAAAKALLRPGFPDWCLLKCGDSWDEWIGELADQFGNPLSGRSQYERMVFASYGSGPRPLLRTAAGPMVRRAGFVGLPLQYVYILGIEAWAQTYNGFQNPPFGIDFDASNGANSYIHVEDCKFRNMNAGFEDLFGGATDHLVFRRNVIVDCFPDNFTGECYGVNLWHAAAPDISENVIDNIYPAFGQNCPTSRVGIFLQPSVTGALVHDNIVTRCGSKAIVAWGGGDISNNLVAENPFAITAGHWDPPGGFPITVYQNVILEANTQQTTCTPFPQGGHGIEVYNASSGNVSRNIVTQNSHTEGLGIYLDGAHFDTSGNPAAIRNVTANNNRIFKFGTPPDSLFYIAGANTSQLSIVNLTTTGNDVQAPGATSGQLYGTGSSSVLPQIQSANNRFWRGGTGTNWYSLQVNTTCDFATWSVAINDTGSNETNMNAVGGYPSPNQTLGTYAASIGVGSTSLDFINACRAQSKQSWNPSLKTEIVNPYFRQGFGL